jgi:Cdc6-like AAA superfamily ATPase
MIENILLIGMCGTGKTWVMKSLIRERKVLKKQKICKLYFHSNDDLIVLGKYDGSLFEGSDRLSMSAITDISLLLQSVCTRVSNINANFIVENSVDALKLINKLIDEGYDEGQK